MEQLRQIAGHFLLQGHIDQISPLGNGLINDTYLITTSDDTPDYVLQRINHAIFRDVELLQHNIETVTAHIRHKLEVAGAADIERKVLQFIKTSDGKTYYKDEDGNYWRISVFISGAQTYETVNPEYSYDAGKAFGQFEAMLTDLSEPLGETIPDFHNMELRCRQLNEAIAADPVGRVAKATPLIDSLLPHAQRMCMAEQMFREGKLPKRICHCDTKVNNMMFDGEGNVLCVIDLDTVMPSFVFSDYGDFLRTAANKAAEDEPNLSRVTFDFDIFRAFTKGYLESACQFLTPTEIDNLPYAAALFPYMQSVRFLTDYINGDTYYKIQYGEHNLVRAQSQYRLFQCVEKHAAQMKAFIQECLSPTLLVPKIFADIQAAEQVAALLDDHHVEWQPIACANWQEHPYTPEVRFRLAHTGSAILLQYAVSEESVRALALDNGKVWEDACCECFVQMEGGGDYYNIECNCAGKILVGAGSDRHNRTRASQAILDGIARYSSLGSETFPERPSTSPWQLSLIIPASTFFHHAITDLSGLTIRANFYKCGDQLPKPHFLSWRPITLPKPDFHQPSFFGLLKLE